MLISFISRLYLSRSSYYIVISLLLRLYVSVLRYAVLRTDDFLFMIRQFLWLADWLRRYLSFLFSRFSFSFPIYTNILFDFIPVRSRHTLTRSHTHNAVLEYVQRLNTHFMSFARWDETRDRKIRHRVQIYLSRIAHTDMCASLCPSHFQFLCPFHSQFTLICRFHHRRCKPSKAFCVLFFRSKWQLKSAIGMIRRKR